MDAQRAASALGEDAKIRIRLRSLNDPKAGRMARDRKISGCRSALTGFIASSLGCDFELG
jgi:hypothetical protein